MTDLEQQLQEFSDFAMQANAAFGVGRWSLTASMMGSAVKATMTVFYPDGGQNSQFVVVNAFNFTVETERNGKLEVKTDWEHATRCAVFMLATLFGLSASNPEPDEYGTI